MLNITSEEKDNKAQGMLKAQRNKILNVQLTQVGKIYAPQGVENRKIFTLLKSAYKRYI